MDTKTAQTAQTAPVKFVKDFRNTGVHPAGTYTPGIVTEQAPAFGLVRVAVTEREIIHVGLNHDPSDLLQKTAISEAHLRGAWRAAAFTYAHVNPQALTDLTRQTTDVQWEAKTVANSVHASLELQHRVDVIITSGVASAGHRRGQWRVTAMVHAGFMIGAQAADSAVVLLAIAGATQIEPLDAQAFVSIFDAAISRGFSLGKDHGMPVFVLGEAEEPMSHDEAADFLMNKIN